MLLGLILLLRQQLLLYNERQNASAQYGSSFDFFFRISHFVCWWMLQKVFIFLNFFLACRYSQELNNFVIFAVPMLMMVNAWARGTSRY